MRFGQVPPAQMVEDGPRQQSDPGSNLTGGWLCPMLGGGDML